jgi:hypothetical protein
MQVGDIKPVLYDIIARLKEIARYTNSNACCTATTTSGVNTSVPAGLGSVAIALTDGSANITLSDGSVYPMIVVGEVFVDSAPFGASLPAYAISGSGTWKWHGIS